ncbi:MAG: hypothetical protein HGA65_08190 [Oscillochloris sp.]|nr:hypothetical protein [Oscillochloris sp.]
MTNQNDGFDFTDPIGTWRTIRDANLDAWAKGMATLVNTEAFSKALGLQLDTMLAASAPVQKTMTQYTEAYLAQANLPSRTEIVSLAQRMTNIEMRLDDMDARLDEILSALRVLATPAPAAESAPAAEPDAAEAESKPAPRRSRKGATE